MEAKRHVRISTSCSLRPVPLNFEKLKLWTLRLKILKLLAQTTYFKSWKLLANG